MLSRINFKKKDKNLVSLGRNGDINTTGLEIFCPINPPEYVELTPLTSKGLLGRCRIRIPLEQETIQSIINALEEIKGFI